MSADIFGDRFLGRTVPAWHKLGTVFETKRQIGVEEAVREAGCGYELAKVPLAPVHVFGHDITFDQHAIVRAPVHDDPIPRVLGIVGQDYQIADPITLARILEPLAKEWPVETVFALRQGESTVITLKIGRIMLKGVDAVDRYFLINGNHGNNLATKITETTVHVVCANTLKMALGGGSVIALTHTPGTDIDIAAATAIIGKMHQTDDIVVRQLERLVMARVTEEQVSQIIEAAYPFPTEPQKAKLARQANDVGMQSIAKRFDHAVDSHRYQINAIEQRRFEAMQCWEKINAEIDEIAGTAWAALNAVTEVENHHPGRSEASVNESIIDGPRCNTMTRALAESIRIADIILR